MRPLLYTTITIKCPNLSEKIATSLQIAKEWITYFLFIIVQPTEIACEISESRVQLMFVTSFATFKFRFGDSKPSFEFCLTCLTSPRVY